MMLPAEILLQIFDYAHDHVRRPIEYQTGTGALLSLSLVCREWKNVAERLLYRKIKLDYRPTLKRQPTYDVLRQSLKQRLNRYEYIQDLELAFSLPYGVRRDNVVEDFAEVLNSFCLMSSLGTLSLVGLRIEKLCAESVNQISSMPIKTLCVSAGWALSLFQHITTTNHGPGFAALKNLTTVAVRSVQDKLKLKAHHQKTSNLDSVKFEGCDSKIINQLLQWPRALKQLEIKRTSACISIHTGSLQQWLDLQSASLETITISCYPSYWNTAGVLPNLTHFSSLARISFNRRNVYQTAPRLAAESLSSAHLTTFEVSPDEDDGAAEVDLIHIGWFNENHTEWILDFAMSYREINPNGTLCMIDLQFPCFLDFGIAALGSSEQWSHDCFAYLEPKIAELGIRLNVTFR